MAEIRSQFGGVAGRELGRSLSRSAAVSGMALVSCLFLSARGLGSIGGAGWFPVTALVLVSFGLAYHAVRAVAENDVAHPATAGRILSVGLLTAIASSVWFVPWMLWGASLGPRFALLEAIGAPPPLAAGLYVLAVLVATPVLLIASAHSSGRFDVFSPAHWGRQFRGRGQDLMTVYTIQTGGLVLATGFALPLVATAVGLDATAGFAVAGLAVCLVLGYWVALTGRLCGAIHASPARPVEAPAQPRFDEGLAIAGSALDTDLNRDLPERIREDEPDLQPESPIPTEEAEPIRPDREAARIRRYAAPPTPVAFDVPQDPGKKRRTPLLDAEARVEDAMKRFRLDPSHTLSKLAELNHNFALNAHVLQALAICLHRTGHKELALKSARQAFPLCFASGYVSLAAALFYELRAELHQFDLKQEQVLDVAAVLHKSDELAAAAKAYSLVVHADPSEVRAITGLIDVADRILQEKDKPAAALKVYMFLLEQCSDSSMVEIVRDGISRCRDVEEAAQPV